MWYSGKVLCFQSRGRGFETDGGHIACVPWTRHFIFSSRRINGYLVRGEWFGLRGGSADYMHN